MADEDLAQITAGELETVPHLLATSEALQISFIIMAVGIIGIVVGYRKFSLWVGSQRFYYRRPHISRFLRRAVLPVFAIALITGINVHVQTGILDGEETAAATARAGLSASESFAKILNTFNILVIGYTVSHLIPIALTKREKSILEKRDFDAWFRARGFADDEGDLFHKMYKWVPPREPPEEMDGAEFRRLLETEGGRSRLEGFHTAKGNPIGSYEKIVKDPFVRWQASERAKYDKYYEDCISGNNLSGIKLRPGARPAEIFPIDRWREEKRLLGYERLRPGSYPSGYTEKKMASLPKTTKQILPTALFAATVLGALSWWGVDLFVLATATGGFSIGLGLALQETMKNYFAYMRIRKDKIFVEGDRIKLESGFNGYVHKITPHVTYIRAALHESIAIIPTNNLIAAQVINYTKENQLVPVFINVGVSYLNNPRQVAAILVKVGQLGMRTIVDSRKAHLIRQTRCPYLDESKPSCGCDKELHVDLSQPVVRFTNFNDSSLDFSLRLFVRDYGSQFKVSTDLRIMIHEEFLKYDIRIPWPIRTIYQSDDKKEAEEIGKLDKTRSAVLDEYGVGDIYEESP